GVLDGYDTRLPERAVIHCTRCESGRRHTGTESDYELRPETVREIPWFRSRLDRLARAGQGESAAAGGIHYCCRATSADSRTAGRRFGQDEAAEGNGLCRMGTGPPRWQARGRSRSLERDQGRAGTAARP